MAGVVLRFGFLGHCVRLIDLEPQQLDVVHGGFLEGIEEIANQEAIDCQSMESLQFLFVVLDLSLVFENLAILIGARAEIVLKPIQVAFHNHRLDQQGTAPDQNEHDGNHSGQDESFHRIAAALPFKGLSICQQIDADRHDSEGGQCRADCDGELRRDVFELRCLLR